MAKGPSTDVERYNTEICREYLLYLVLRELELDSREFFPVA